MKTRDISWSTWKLFRLLIPQSGPLWLSEISKPSCVLILNNLFRKTIYSFFPQRFIFLTALLLDGLGYLALLIFSSLFLKGQKYQHKYSQSCVSSHNILAPSYLDRKASLCSHLYSPICAASQKPCLICIEGHCADFCVAMATSKLFDFLPSVYHPEGNRRPRIRTDYLQENNTVEKLNIVPESTIFI